MKVTRTYTYKLGKKHNQFLETLAGKVNYVWNYLNATQRKHFKDKSHKPIYERFLSWIDLIELTNGTSKHLNLPAQTITFLCRRYDEARKRCKRAWLRFRPDDTLGWVPFTKQAIRRIDNEGFNFMGRRICPIHWKGLPRNARILDGSNFHEDANGNWHLKLTIEYEIERDHRFQSECAGIDLGVKTKATLATPQGNSRKIESTHTLKQHEKELGLIQKRMAASENKNGKVSNGLKKQFRRKHKKVANIRNHDNHVHSRRIANAYQVIKVGNVSVKWLKEMFGKKVSDSAMSDFKTKLCYKSEANGGVYMEVDESYSTQTCSECGGLPPSRPKGIACLGMREWRCDYCGETHDRDVNAAVNISRAESRTPAEEAISPQGA